MTPEIIESADPSQFDDLIPAEPHSTGTEDDDDDRDDERASENEASIRETDENTESPEEFENDDEDELGHPEDDEV